MTSKVSGHPDVEARLRSIVLAVDDVAAQRTFYGVALGLPVSEEGSDGFTVTAGATCLVLRKGRGSGGSYHVAFNIPENLLDEAAEWLRARGIFICTHNGQEIVTQPPHWDARSVYFPDADGNVLELIARHRLGDRANGPFDPAHHVRCASEVGLPAEGAQAAAERLMRETGLQTYGIAQPAFLPLGDERGLLIVVERGRHWFPTTTPALSEPVEIQIQATAVDAEDVVVKPTAAI